MENKKKRIKCGGNGPRVTIADVLVEMRNGFNQVNYRLDNIEADVKDLKVRVTKLEDNFDEMNNGFEERVVKILDEHHKKWEANFEDKIIKILDERDEKWEAKFDEMNNSFEDKVIKVIKKFNKSEKN